MKNICHLSGIGIAYFYIIGCKVNDKMYVGATRNPSSRYSSHISKLRKNKHSNKSLQNDFNRFGEENFVFRVIDASTDGWRGRKEKEWMEKLKTYDPNYGYNQNDAYFRGKKKA